MKRSISRILLLITIFILPQSVFGGTATILLLHQELVKLDTATAQLVCCWVLLTMLFIFLTYAYRCFLGKLHALKVLEKKLSKLQNTVQDFQNRYRQVQHFALENMLAIDSYATRNLFKAAEVLRMAEDYLELVRSEYEQGSLKEVDNLLEYRFTPGMVLGYKYDGTKIVLPRSKLWMVQLNELLLNVEKQSKIWLPKKSPE